MNKEAIELLEKARSVARVAEANKAGYKCIEQHIDQALTLLKQQPPASEFTKRVRILLTTQDRTAVVQDAYDLCGRLDRAEASNKDLLTALEQIRDLETECCPRCEGNGRLYADGKAHHVSENADTIFCGNCGGSGRILPDNAQEIAEAAMTEAHI